VNFKTSKPEWALLGICLTLILVALLGPAVAQPANHHHFADQRGLWGIPCAWDVLSNLPFALMGFWGLSCLKRVSAISRVQRTCAALFFFGLVATAVCSSWYHWRPDDAGLAVDRLGMVVAFAGLIGLAVADRISARAGMVLAALVLVLGPLSVQVWAATASIPTSSPCSAAPLCAVLLDAVFRRSQRQPVQVRLHGDGDLPAASWLAAAGHGRAGDRGAVHPAVSAVQRHQRPAGRQVRQAHAHPLCQAAGDRHHGAGGLGLFQRQRARPAGLHLSDGRALHAVRPGQVCLPAPGPERARTDRRQRHGRDGHLCGHPAGQRGGRPDHRRARDRRAPCGLCLRGHGHRGAGGVAVHPRVTRHRPRPEDQLEPVHRDLAQPQAGARATSWCSARCWASAGCGSLARCS
jgi:hypothetical protein